MVRLQLRARRWRRISRDFNPNPNCSNPNPNSGSSTATGEEVEADKPGGVKQRAANKENEHLFDGQQQQQVLGVELRVGVEVGVEKG